MKFYQKRNGEIISLENILEITCTGLTYGLITIYYKDTDRAAVIKVDGKATVPATMKKIAEILKGGDE